MFIELPLFLCWILLWAQSGCFAEDLFQRTLFSSLECAVLDSLPRAEIPGMEGAAQGSKARTFLQWGT